MAEWRIEGGGRTRVVSEGTLREELRDGRLSGAELVRPPGATGWVPLHSLAVFSEEVPVRRAPKGRNDDKAARGWFIHLAVFIVVVLWAGKGTIPPWAMFWGIGVLAHSLRGVPAAVRLVQGMRDRPPKRITSVVSQIEAPATPTAAPKAVTTDPFLAEVDDAVRAVEAVWKRGAAALGPSPDLVGLQAAARRLDERHKALKALHLGEDRDALAAELDAARSREASAIDAVTADVHGEEARAIEERLAGIDAAISVSEQIAARKRTLLHQLAGLKLAAGQTAATHDGTEPARVAGTLVDKTATLRDALQASSEVDEALVRARKAAAARHRSRS